MSSNNKIVIARNSIDASTENDEPYFLLEENSFPPRSSIAKDDDMKRVDALIETTHENLLKKEEEQPQQSPFPSSEEMANTSTVEQHTRRTVTFDDDYHQSFLSSTRRDSISNGQQKERNSSSHLSNIPVESDQTNSFVQDTDNLLVEDEYIPGGFVNLDEDLEEELLNDFDEELDSTIIRRNQRISTLHSSELAIAVTRSPIELWQRARILIAIHLYQKQNRIPNSTDNTFPMLTKMQSSVSKTIDDIDHYEEIEHAEDRKINFGLTIFTRFLLDSSQQYHNVDFYDVEQGYIIVSNVINVNNFKSDTTQISRNIVPSEKKPSKLYAYAMSRHSSNDIQSVQFDCSFQFDFMICIPIFRLILGFMNLKSHKTLMILIGDVSRKGMFLSKQEIPERISSVLYIHEASLLFIGCLGRVLQYNTQPLQFTSSPLLISELSQLSLQSHEPIIHMCDVRTHQSVGFLSDQYFLLYRYGPNEQLSLKFCNPFQYGWNRCHYQSKYDYLIFALIDGTMFIYQLNQMRQIRRYQCHWKTITDLKATTNLLLSSSLDRRLNVYSLETLQHIYQYDAYEEVYQIDILHENLFYYRTSQQLVLFQLKLHTLVFSILKTNVRTLKVFKDTQRTSRLLAMLDDYSCVLISPVSGCCLTRMPNVAKKDIKQVLHDISRSSIYALDFDGEIVLYRAHNDPCVAEYKIRSKSEQSAITCMALINPMRTHLFTLGTMQISTEKSLAKQAIFFGHANGYITLFQGDSLIMEPLLAHRSSLVCLESSQASMETTQISFMNSEILLSCSADRRIHLWDFSINKNDELIQLVHILTVEQEKNISQETIRFLSMIDNFLVATYSDQKFLHIWQLLNISIQTNEQDRWGIVEHPTKGSHHRGQIQAISATSKLKLFSSSDTEGSIKIWDSTNTLLREIYLDQTLNSVEFLCQSGELVIGYQNNLHLILPEYYLLGNDKSKTKQLNIVDIIAEDNRLEVLQPLIVPYQSLPVFDYKLKHHHTNKRLQTFERQLAGDESTFLLIKFYLSYLGRFVVIDNDSSQSDNEQVATTTSDRASIVSDDADWSGLAEDVKDVLRMKKHAIRYENKK
ncbi:unnamed protein product [Adineta ricciae]|uniref:Uncharacterized protein n=1 Tax=Adineta ricciae TaxID=249248 RepID=A0A813UHS2_ADIRI|nr:unnamed protein product [Adineta ricciae]CAF0826750.1 unnamed protein product [Adineta ricciae]